MLHDGGPAFSKIIAPPSKLSSNNRSVLDYIQALKVYLIGTLKTLDLLYNVSNADYPGLDHSCVDPPQMQFLSLR